MGFDNGERRWGEQEGATGWGDGEKQGNTTGFKLSLAEAGDGEGAEGKGDCAGNGKPDGFAPSPADANQGKGAEAKGDGEGQGKPIGFRPSTADAKKIPERSLILRVMMFMPRGWLRPTERLAQEKC